MWIGSRPVLSLTHPTGRGLTHKRRSPAYRPNEKSFISDQGDPVANTGHGS